jgi:uncharacterized protein (TIGR03437 family)
MSNRTKNAGRLLTGLSGLFFATGLFAQTITSVQNPASNILPGLPNYGIAEGSIFVIYGSGLGPAAISIAPTLPFGTTLSGTSVTIAAGGQNYAAFLVYTVSSQVAAVMPSNVPAGAATVTVTYNGSTGAAFSTIVVVTNFGISTVNQSGAGPAVVTLADFSVVTATNSAKPGSTYTIWGTGLGPKAASDNNVAAGPIAVSIQVWVGGQQANTTYVGRSGGVGLDQINFTVPAGLSGCSVSIVVQTGNIVSNTATLPIAGNGGSCSDSVNPAASDPRVTAALAKGSLSVGVVSLGQSNISLTILGTTIMQSVNNGAANFIRYTPVQYAAAANTSMTASIGSCTVSVAAPSVGGVPAAPNYTGLDAGPVIAVAPGGNLTGTAGFKGTYSGQLSTLAAGNYQVTGTGGADVGAFSLNLAVPAPLVWSNQAAVVASPIIRAQGQTVTWTGGDPGSYVTILGTSPTAGANPTSVSFICTAPISAGRFTIPAPVLLALPASTISQGTPNGSMFVGSNTTPVPFTASGLDIAFAVASSASLANVTYQ